MTEITTNTTKNSLIYKDGNNNVSPYPMVTGGVAQHVFANADIVAGTAYKLPKKAIIRFIADTVTTASVFGFSASSAYSASVAILPLKDDFTFATGYEDVYLPYKRGNWSKIRINDIQLRS